MSRRQVAYNMDCMDFMRLIPDKEFDLAIVDPPYGIGIGGGKIGAGVLAKCKDYQLYAGNDEKCPEKEFFYELERCCKNQIIFGANHMMTKINKDSPCWIVWDKDNGNNSFADCELAYTSFKTAVRKFTFKWMGMLQGDMKNKEDRIHPNQKPVRLYEWILRNYAKPGDRILDTHLGSGSSRIAAYKLGFDFVGIEKDAFYFHEQEKRFRQACSQQNLFDVDGGIVI